MRSYFEEMALLSRMIVEKAQQGDAVLAPGQKASLKNLGVPDSMTEGFQQWDPNDKPDLAICMLYRGKYYLPGNKLGMCIDCGEVVQMTPNLVPMLLNENLKPICVFCVEKRDNKREEGSND